MLVPHLVCGGMPLGRARPSSSLRALEGFLALPALSTHDGRVVVPLTGVGSDRIG